METHAAYVSLYYGANSLYKIGTPLCVVCSLAMPRAYSRGREPLSPVLPLFSNLHQIPCRPRNIGVARCGGGIENRLGMRTVRCPPGTSAPCFFYASLSPSSSAAHPHIVPSTKFVQCCPLGFSAMACSQQLPPPPVFLHTSDAAPSRVHLHVPTPVSTIANHGCYRILH